MQHEMVGAVPDGPDRPVPPLPSPERLQQLLFDASRLGRADMIAPLLHAGADIGERDAQGYTALILACYHGHEEAAELLLARGAPVDQPDGARGNTALMGVAFKGFTRIAERLLDAGADPDAINLAGQTALMLAALFGHEAIVDHLIARGANPHLRDAAGNCAASVAGSQGNDRMVERLYRNGSHASERGG